MLTTRWRIDAWRKHAVTSVSMRLSEIVQRRGVRSEPPEDRVGHPEREPRVAREEDLRGEHADVRREERAGNGRAARSRRGPPRSRRARSSGPLLAHFEVVRTPGRVCTRSPLRAQPCQPSCRNCHVFGRLVVGLIPGDEMDSLVRASLLLRRICPDGLRDCADLCARGLRRPRRRDGSARTAPGRARRRLGAAPREAPPCEAPPHRRRDVRPRLRARRAPRRRPRRGAPPLRRDALGSLLAGHLRARRAGRVVRASGAGPRRGRRGSSRSTRSSVTRRSASRAGRRSPRRPASRPRSRSSTCSSSAPRSRGSASLRARVSSASSSASATTPAATGSSARATSPRQKEDAEERLARSSVEEIHQSVHYALELLRRSLDLHTAVLLWRTDSGTHLRISELSTASDEIHDAPFSIGDGVLAAVIAKKEARAPRRTSGPRTRCPTTRAPCPVRALAAIPRHRATASSAASSPLDRVENRAVHAARARARRAGRALLPPRDPERARVRAARARQGRAGQALSRRAGARRRARREGRRRGRRARRPRDRELRSRRRHDLGRERRRCTRSAPRASDGGRDRRPRRPALQAQHRPRLDGRQNRFPLPYNGEYDPAHQVVLSKRLPWPKIPSLLVLPLLHHGRPLGTLILGAKRRHAFGDTVRPTLEVLASHLAVCLSNARMVHKLETMATTDGLTGLLNKRAMLDAAAAEGRRGDALRPQALGAHHRHRLLQEGQRHATATTSATS